MRYSIFFVIVLVLASGFIAYFGDLLGRKMGKKRLTLFHMRPRYTAIVMTTITGMLISALVLLTLVSINPAFKRIFAEGDQILDRNKTLAFANIGLENRNGSLVARSKVLEQKVDEANSEWNKAKIEVQRARKAMDAAVKAKNAAQKNIVRLKDDIAKRLVELVDLKQRNDVAEKEIRLAANQLKGVQQKLASEQSKLKIAQTDMLIAKATLTVEQANLAKTGAQLADATQTLQQLEEKIKLQEEQIKEQQAALVSVGEASLRSERQTLELRSSELVLRQGEELVRGTISSSSTAFGVTADLKGLLDVASDKAQALGAKKSSGERAVTVVYRSQGEQDGMVTEDLCIKMATGAILRSFSDALVQVVCASNTIQGEKVPVEFRLYRNSQIMRNGRLIASVRLDGSQSEGRILLNVIDFLRTDVSEAALRAGIIPVANPDPRTSMGKDPASQVEQLMAVVNQIKTENARVKLEAYANEDIFAAGPLTMDNMRFKIVKIE